MVKDQRFQPHLIDILYRQSYAVLFANFVIPVPVVYVLWDFIHSGILLFWTASIYILTIARVFISSQYFKLHPPGAKKNADWKMWAWRFAVLSWISSSLWGLLGWFGFQADEPQLQAFTTIVLTGLVCGAIPSLSAFPPAYAGSLVAMLIPLAGRSIFGEASINDVYLLFVLCLAGVNLYYSRISYRSMVETVSLRFENLSLIGQLKEERDRAQAADRGKTRFLAAASHDLRQPLHALGLFNSTLAALGQRGEVSGDEARNLARRVKSILGNLSGLLNALLDISRLDAGIATVTREPVSLSRLFDDLYDEFAGTAKRRNLEWRLVDTDLWVETDPMMLKRVLGNLLSNAFNYTENGRVLLGCRRRGPNVEIQVIDTGIGIPTDQHAAIFDEFFQLHNPARDREKGLGLGLSIVRRTADLLGHPLKIESTEGRGSSFSVSIPRAARPSPLAPPHIADPIRHSRCIMVVDDEPDVLDAIRQLLTVVGYRVYAGRSAREVTQLHTTMSGHSRSPVDLIIADYRLENGATGLDVIGELQQYMGRSIPAFLLSGDTSPSVLKSISESGYRLLSKPVDGDELQKAISEAFQPLSS
jgi:signal transduction histidine kinase/CheY-like chemotaxis protein